MAAPSYRRPTLRAALWLYFFMLALSAVTIVAVQVDRHALRGVRLQIALAVAFSLVVLPWAIVYARSLAPRLRSTGSPKWYLLAAVAPLGTFAVASATLWVFKRTVSAPILDETIAYRLAGYGFGWAVLTDCCVPAFFEEIAFRGIIFDGLARHLTTVETVHVSATIFGILHLSILSLPNLLTIGLLLAMLRAKTGSLLPGMMAHFLHNLLVCGSEWTGLRWLW